MVGYCLLIVPFWRDSGWGWAHITLPIGRQLFNLRFGKLIVYLFFTIKCIFFSWSLKNAPVDMYKAQTIRLKFYVGVFIYSSILLCTNDTLQHPVPYHVKHHIFNRTINDWSIKVWSSCITNLTHTDISCPICQYI